MFKMAREGHQLGFRRAIWLWTALTRYGGFRRQEFAMEKKDIIQVYVKPNGETVVRAFTIQDFLFYDKDGILVCYKEVIKQRSLAQQTGQHYGIKKNRMNDQIVKQTSDLVYPAICPFEIAIGIVEIAIQLGANNPITHLPFRSGDV